MNSKKFLEKANYFNLSNQGGLKPNAKIEERIYKMKHGETPLDKNVKDDISIHYYNKRLRI